MRERVDIGGNARGGGALHSCNTFRETVVICRNLQNSPLRVHIVVRNI
jgi:hypothetical protein